MDLISKILGEASQYQSFEDLEKLVELGVSLQNLPLQPLYLSLVHTSEEHLAAVLPKLSKSQRQALLDLDLWHKDVVDGKSFARWPRVYAACQNEDVVNEFVQSEEFLLYLKGHVTLHTFDVEEPEYPDHDYYFLTEDNLLLVDYGEEFEDVDALRFLIRSIYSLKGVEHAYTFLFKLISDSYSILEEENYQRKKENLRDYGFIDYFEALEILSPFMTLKNVENYIKSKKSATPQLDSSHQNQSLHADTLMVFSQGMDEIQAELSKITSEKRESFLHFNLVRSINAAITLDDSLKGGRMALTKTTKKTKQRIKLGFSYVKYLMGDISLFEQYDFLDFYKVGSSLIEMNRRQMKKALFKSPFESDEYEYFLGNFWKVYLEGSFDEVATVKYEGKLQGIDSYPKYEFWTRKMKTLIEGLPYFKFFFDTFNQLKESGKLRDDFYLNYEVASIDLEALLISSFINFSLGYYEQESNPKLGLSINELRNFMKKFAKLEGKEYWMKPFDQCLNDLNLFIIKFGLENVVQIEKYLYRILEDNLNGYEIDTLAPEDFKHVGGPILLNLN